MSSEWRKASYSGGQSASCVEVATNDAILVRDTTNREGYTLSLSPSAWAAFVGRLRKALLAAESTRESPGHGGPGFSVFRIGREPLEYPCTPLRIDSGVLILLGRCNRLAVMLERLGIDFRRYFGMARAQSSPARVRGNGEHYSPAVPGARCR
jgi:hypothetical protein